MSLRVSLHSNPRDKAASSYKLLYGFLFIPILETKQQVPTSFSTGFSSFQSSRQSSKFLQASLRVSLHSNPRDKAASSYKLLYGFLFIPTLEAKHDTCKAFLPTVYSDIDTQRVWEAIYFPDSFFSYSYLTQNYSAPSFLKATRINFVTSIRTVAPSAKPIQTIICSSPNAAGMAKTSLSPGISVTL